jgi:hypothetical protein
MLAKVHQRMKVSQNHKLVPVTSEDSKGHTTIYEKFQALSKQAICPIHKDELKYYDEDCCKAICRDCFALNHRGHNCISIGQAASNMRSLIESRVQELKGQVDGLKRIEAGVGGVRNELQREYERVHREVGDVFDKVRCLY